MKRSSPTWWQKFVLSKKHHHQRMSLNCAPFWESLITTASFSQIFPQSCLLCMPFSSKTRNGIGVPSRKLPSNQLNVHCKQILHFDPKKPLVLTCNTSQYGLGAVLSHVMEDGKYIQDSKLSRTELLPNWTWGTRYCSRSEVPRLPIIMVDTSRYNQITNLCHICSMRRREMLSPRVQRWAVSLPLHHSV